MLGYTLYEGLSQTIPNVYLHVRRSNPTVSIDHEIVSQTTDTTTLLAFEEFVQLFEEPISDYLYRSPFTHRARPLPIHGFDLVAQEVSEVKALEMLALLSSP